MSIWDFSDLIVDVPKASRISLGEGHTPLIRSRRIGPAAGLKHLFFKVETTNPTGSYKDRFAAAAISSMRAENQELCLATSSGNTGAALAAYCASAGLACRIAVVETAPNGKLLQMQAYGAHLARVQGFGLDDTITEETFAALQRHATAASSAAVQISAYKYSPTGMCGVQTISYEIAKQLPEGADHVFSPAGGGGLTLAVARGFSLLHRRSEIKSVPAIHCVQPSGNNTIAGPLRAGGSQAQAVKCTSKISGLQVPNVIDGNEVLTACRDTRGNGHLVGDPQVWAAQRRLATEEGIFCEPAGAVALAGALQAQANQEIASETVIVCLVTGSAFKDPHSLERMASPGDCPTIQVEEVCSWIGKAGGNRAR